MENRRHFVNMQFTAASKGVTSVKIAPVTKEEDMASNLMH